jgi:ABC-2 type transport system permease protein
VRGSARVTAALVRKEFLQIARDPSALMIALCLPLLLLFIFGYGVNLDSSRPAVGLVVQADGAVASALSDALAGSKFFDLSSAKSRQELSGALMTGGLRGLVVIPPDLQRDFQGGREASVQVITDGTEPNSALFVRNYAVGALRGAYERDRQASGRAGPEALIAIEGRHWYNQELKSRNFLVPGSLAIVMTLVGVMLTSLVISREWERGTMEALMATPVTIGQIIASKLLAYYLLALMSAFLSWAVAVLWYEVPFRGSLLALLALSTVYLLGALGQGLLISTLSKSQFVSAQWAIITGFLPSFMFSGFVFELASIPSPFQEATYAVAARYLVPCLQTIFLVGDVWPLFWRSMASMAAVAAVFYLLTLKKTVKRIF